MLATMTVTESRALITLCHLVLFITVCSLRFANTDIRNYVDINELPWVNTENENPIPIVGILSQKVSKAVARRYPNKNITGYIAASYVKFVEGAGGRVIPIWTGKEREYYEDIMSKINGILLPGGVTSFNISTPDYGDASRHIYNIAVEKNDRGVHFPIWGTCLGFQYFFYITANETDIRSDCQSWGQGLPLEFKDDFQQSRMFRNAAKDVINTLSKYPVTSNFHNFCVIEEIVAEYNLTESWRVISVNHDWKGIKFISTIEHKRYPFYGVQFHPEKTLYEFKRHRNITHSTRAARAAQHFANFFASETRRNHQHFSNSTEEQGALIYNYSPTYTDLTNLSLVQQYFFEGDRQHTVCNNAGSGGGPHYSIRNVLSFIMSYLCAMAINRLL